MLLRVCIPDDIAEEDAIELLENQATKIYAQLEHLCFMSLGVAAFLVESGDVANSENVMDAVKQIKQIAESFAAVPFR